MSQASRAICKFLTYLLAILLWILVIGLAVYGAYEFIHMIRNKLTENADPNGVTYSDNPEEDLNIKTLLYIYPESMFSGYSKEAVISALKNEVQYLGPDMMKHWNQIYLDSLKK